jgi:hypothetical protein
MMPIMEKNLVTICVFAFFFLLIPGQVNGETLERKHFDSPSLQDVLKQKQWKSTTFAEKAPGKPHGSRKEKEPVDSQEIIVEGIDFKVDKYGPEKILIYLNQFYLPKIFAIQGEKPRIVVDIKNVFSWKNKPVIQVDGVFVKKIRTHLHSTTKKLRIVLDLNPSKNYVADQSFFKKDNIFCITIGAERENKTETDLKK